MKHLKRWMSFFLTAVMLLPMLVIPSVAEDGAMGELYCNDFELYANREGDYLAKSDGFANTMPSKTQVAKDGENTYLKLPLESANDPNKTVYYTYINGVYTLVEAGTEGAYCTDEASYGLISGNDANLNKNIQLRQPALDYEETPVVVLQTRFYLSEDAKGKIQSQFHKYSSDGGEAKTWFSLFVIETATGCMNIGGRVYANACLEKGAWSTVSVVIDLQTGSADYYVNFACVAQNVALGFTNLNFAENSWIIAKVPRTNSQNNVAATELGGWIGLDEACIYTLGEERTLSVPEINEEGEKLLYTEVIKNGTVQHINDSNSTFLKANGYSFRPVYFETDDYRGVIPTASESEIRLTDEGGIRFLNSLDLEKYAALEALEREGTISELSFGTLIAPKLYVDRAGALTVEALDELRESVAYVKVNAGFGAWYEETADGGVRFAGSLLGIKPSHYTDGFAAVGYVSFKLQNGKTQYLYGTAGAAISVAELADGALQVSKEYTNAELAYLNSFEPTEFSLKGSTVSDVFLVSDYLFFRVGDAYACLTYTGNYGWRLKAQSADHLGFEGKGAAQALAAYMNEESPDQVLPILASVTADGTLRITTADGTYAELNGSVFSLCFYSPKGEQTAYIEKILVGDETVEFQGRLDGNEAVFGGGERFDSVNRRGTRMALYSTDRWNNSGATYMTIPLFTTSRGGGIYVNRYESITADFACSMRNTWSITIKNDVMDCYFFASGDMRDAIIGYTRLTGEADTPEEWAYGVMICRYSKDFQTFEKDQIDPATGELILNKDNAPSGRSVKTIVNALMDAGMKPSAVVMEPWRHTDISLDNETAQAKRDELQATIDWLDELDIKTMLYIQVGGSFSASTMVGYKEEYLLHAYVTVNGVTKYTSQIPTVAGDGSNPDASSTSTRRYLDVTNPEARAWYYDVIWGQLIDMGIDGVKIDFCEELPDEDYDYNGTTFVYDWYDPTVIPQGGEHHSYPVYFISSFYKRMNELKKANGETDGFFVLSRGGGIGSQRNPYMWAGDQARNFEKLDDQLIAVVTSGMSGVPFMTYDMAGYRYGGGGTAYANADSLAYESEMFARAIAFTAFMPNIQTHGTVRNVYEMTKETQQIYRNFLALRDVLTPYITELTQYAAQTGIPVARHPVLHFQSDTGVYSIKTQFMLGDGLMIAPILERGKSTREIYLPEGSWTNLLTGKQVTGGQTITVTANLGQVPVFLNNNSANAAELRAIFAGNEWQAIQNWK